MPPDYNFWVYIVTNEYDSVLYTGMTNDLARRISEHRAGGIPGFTSDYRCRKLIYYEHCTDVRDAIAREKQLKNDRDQESGGDRNDEPTVERSRARSSRRIVRDVSTSLDMTEKAISVAIHHYRRIFVIPSEVEEPLIFQRMIVRHVSVRTGVAYFLTQPRSSSFGSSTSLDLTKDGILRD